MTDEPISPNLGRKVEEAERLCGLQEFHLKSNYEGLISLANQLKDFPQDFAQLYDDKKNDPTFDVSGAFTDTRTHFRERLSEVGNSLSRYTISFLQGLNKGYIAANKNEKALKTLMDGLTSAVQAVVTAYNGLSVPGDSKVKGLIKTEGLLDAILAQFRDVNYFPRTAELSEFYISVTRFENILTNVKTEVALQKNLLEQYISIGEPAQCTEWKKSAQVTAEILGLIREEQRNPPQFPETDCSGFDEILAALRQNTQGAPAPDAGASTADGTPAPGAGTPSDAGADQSTPGFDADYDPY